MTTQWVIWGYDKDRPLFVAPAVVDIGGCKIKFKLPKPQPNLTPVEIERKEATGWRFKSDCLVHSTDWEIVTTDLANDINQWIADYNQEEMREYISDIREYKPSGKPITDILTVA